MESFAICQPWEGPPIRLDANRTGERVEFMHIAARLAVQSDANGLPVSTAADYHGRNVVLKSLNSQGFSAEIGFDCPKGALVRLRLPCVGVALARITKARGGTLEGAFINPVNPNRLAMVLGASPDLRNAAA